MNDERIDEVIKLFLHYRDSLGISDNPDLERAIDFEDKFCEWICSVKGHEIGPDQCGRPEHDLCYVCDQLATKLIPGYTR